MSMTAPDIDGTGEGPTPVLPARTVTAESVQRAQKAAASLGAAAFAPGELTPVVSQTKKTLGGGGIRDRVITTSYTYTGQNLVDDTGQVARSQYNPSKEASAELRALPLSERLAWLNEWYDRGIYTYGKPSKTGLSDADVNAMEQVLMLANGQYGYTWKTSAALMRKDFPGGQGAGVGRKVTVTAPEDITEYLNEASLRLLGRRLTKTDVDKAIRAIQGTELKRGRAGEDVPSLSVLAEAQVEGAAPREARLYRTATAIDVFRDMLGRARG